MHYSLAIKLPFISIEIEFFHLNKLFDYCYGLICPFFVKVIENTIVKFYSSDDMGIVFEAALPCLGQHLLAVKVKLGRKFEIKAFYFAKFCY